MKSVYSGSQAIRFGTFELNVQAGELRKQASDQTQEQLAAGPGVAARESGSARHREDCAASCGRPIRLWTSIMA